MATHIIVAVAENGVIGRDNSLIWNLPDDMKHFVRSTKGHPVIMGRRTFESMDGPLPKRTNIVISRNKNYPSTGIIPVNSLDQAINEARKINSDIFIIGGADIYRQSESICDIMHITRVHQSFEGDSTFQIQDPQNWKLVHSEYHDKDEHHAHSFTIERYDRIT